jgi:hypothetical protein
LGIVLVRVTTNALWHLIYIAESLANKDLYCPWSEAKTMSLSLRFGAVDFDRISGRVTHRTQRSSYASDLSLEPEPNIDDIGLQQDIVKIDEFLIRFMSTRKIHSKREESQAHPPTSCLNSVSDAILHPKNDTWNTSIEHEFDFKRGTELDYLDIEIMDLDSAIVGGGMNPLFEGIWLTPTGLA